MTIWAWLQPGDKIWKVISDYENGAICVYDEKGEIIMEKKNLSKTAIQLIEENFLGKVATHLNGKDLNNKINIENLIDRDNPMYI